MPPQAPWSPTAHAFAQHQFSHVANFWKQGRHASFRLDALPGGQAELNLTFQLPRAFEVVPPPSQVSPVPAAQHPIPPLFPKGGFPQRSGADTNPKSASHQKFSSRQRKNYQRSVLHRAALAASSLPPPSNGSLRQAAQACVKQLQADKTSKVSTQSAGKRPLLNSPTVLSSPNCSPLAQRIRSDFRIGECEVESPEREFLRSQPSPEEPLPPSSPCVKGLPPPAPLVFTPAKTYEGAKVLDSNVKAVPPTAEGSEIKCLNCDGFMGPSHQCGDLSSPKETVVRNNSRIIKNLMKFCHVCETFHKAHLKCQSCVTPEPPQ